MNGRYRIGLVALLFYAAFMSGFFYGGRRSREAALQNAVIAFQAREKINHGVENMRDVDLCIALGGLPDDCAAILRGMGEAAEGE